MKNCLFCLLLVGMIMGFPHKASSGSSWSGMDIVRFCTGDSVIFDDTTCRAYIQGVTDAHEFFQIKGTQSKSFCIPEDRDRRRKGEKRVVEWIEAFKERLHQKPIVLIIGALNDIFPCPGQKNEK